MQNVSSYTFPVAPESQTGVTVLFNTHAVITVNIYTETQPDTPVYIVQGEGVPGTAHYGICTTDHRGRVKVDILSDGKAVKQTKYAYHIFEQGYTPQLAVLAADNGDGNDFNDVIVILNGPLNNSGDAPVGESLPLLR
nr:fucose-binding lectin II [Trabulsiella odontotermitis]